MADADFTVTPNNINNPLINESRDETVQNVADVLSFLMASVPGADLHAYVADKQNTVSPKNGLSMILESCVLALSHSTMPRGVRHGE